MPTCTPPRTCSAPRPLDGVDAWSLDGVASADAGRRRAPDRLELPA